VRPAAATAAAAAAAATAVVVWTGQAVLGVVLLSPGLAAVAGAPDLDRIH